MSEAIVDDVSSSSISSVSSLKPEISSLVATEGNSKSSKDIKRPPNAYVLWSQAERKKIIEKNPTVHCYKSIGKLLGQEWKSLTEDQRKPFVEEAERLRLFHLKEYPDYKCIPKRKKMKQKREMLLKKGILPKIKHAFDPRAEAFSVKKPLAKTLKATALKPHTSSTESSKNESQYQLQFKIDENFSSNFESVLDRSARLSTIEKLFKIKSTKAIKLLKNQLSVKFQDIPTSGEICVVAEKSHDCICTFDQATGIIMRNNNNLTDMICDVVKEYNDLAYSQGEPICPFYNSSDYIVPKMSELIGDQWMLPNMGFEHLP